MSYSRWISSPFYSYMNTEGRLVIQDVASWSEEEAREMLRIITEYLRDMDDWGREGLK